MRLLGIVASGAVALTILAGCAKTTVTSRQAYEGGPIPRPGRIIVHDFAAHSADVPEQSWVKGHYADPSVPPAPQEMEAGRKLGALVAENLVAEIQAMGLPAVRAQGQPAPWHGDIVIMGYFESIDSGSAGQRIVLGFGQGAASLKTVVEAYLMTDKGLKRLGGGTLDADTGKLPGVAVPLVVAAATGNPIGLIVSSAAKVEGQVSGRTTVEGDAKRTAKEIAEQMKKAFQRQGWIS